MYSEMIQYLTPETVYSQFNTGGEPCSFAFEHTLPDVPVASFWTEINPLSLQV